MVFVTKYRREFFTKKILDDLHPMFASVCTDFEAELVKIDSEDDQVHQLVNYPPKMTESKLVNRLKGISSLLILKEKYPSVQKNYGKALCGRLATLLGAVVVRLLRLFASTLSNSEHRTNSEIQNKEGFALRVYIPARKDGVLRAISIKRIGTAI